MGRPVIMLVDPKEVSKTQKWLLKNQHGRTACIKFIPLKFTTKQEAFVYFDKQFGSPKRYEIYFDYFKQPLDGSEKIDRNFGLIRKPFRKEYTTYHQIHRFFFKEERVSVVKEKQSAIKKPKGPRSMRKKYTFRHQKKQQRNAA